MDRLFLQALAEELAPEVSGARIRGVALDRGRKFLALRTSLRDRPDVVLSFGRDAPGLFRGQAPGGGASTPELKKWLVGAAIARLESSPIDRVVTLALTRKRLSGAVQRVQLVLEVMATRTSLYLVDGDAGTVVDALSSGTPRLGPGERFEPPRPPPGASPLASGLAEFARRGGESSLSKRDLLEATGATPLFVREMRSLQQARGWSASEAFEELSQRLSERRPVLYTSRAGARDGKPMVSPMLLDSELELEPQRMPSFSAAMAEAFRLELELRGRRAAHERVRSAIHRGLQRSEKLERKLTAELEALEAPGELRGRGERLLAALGQARISREGWVAIPDFYDPETKEIEIPIDPRRSLVKNAERMFQMARRSERARESIEARLEELRREREYWEGLELALEDAVEEGELEELAREVGASEPKASARGKAPTPAAGPRRFRTAKGALLLVGRSGRSNEEVTFRLGAPDDLWFHAAGMPGAHVILKPEAGAPPDDEDVETAARLAAYFSKARSSSRVEVMVSERRNVTKIKGAAPGTVRVSAHRALRVVPGLPDAEEPGPEKEG